MIPNFVRVSSVGWSDSATPLGRQQRQSCSARESPPTSNQRSPTVHERRLRRRLRRPDALGRCAAHPCNRPQRCVHERVGATDRHPDQVDGGTGGRLQQRRHGREDVLVVEPARQGPGRPARGTHEDTTQRQRSRADVGRTFRVGDAIETATSG